MITAAALKKRLDSDLMLSFVYAGAYLHCHNDSRIRFRSVGYHNHELSTNPDI